jgi:hypothetical protein
MINVLKRIILGVRAEGESIPQPSFKSVYPLQALSEFDWYKEFRVSVMCNKQNQNFSY